MKKKFLNLLKATRIHRTMTVLATMLIPVAFTNIVTIDVVYFYLSILFLYSGAAIQNAIKDNDYVLPGYSKYVVALFVLFSLLISLTNMIILVTIIVMILLGYYYNNHSRYVLFMDVTATAFTHHAIPMFSTSILLGLNIDIALKLSLYIYVVYWLFIHIKNLKDKEGDKLRKYKTIATEFPNSKKLSIVFYEISFFLMFLGYFIFDFNIYYLYSLIVLFGIKMLIIMNIIENNFNKALHLLRFKSIVFVYSIVFQKATNPFVLLICSIPLINYLFVLAYENRHIFNIKSITPEANYEI